MIKRGGFVGRCTRRRLTQTRWLQSVSPIKEDITEQVEHVLAHYPENLKRLKQVSVMLCYGLPS